MLDHTNDYLREFRGTLLLIAHDRYLLNSLTEVTLEVAGSKAVRYPGNYDHYIEARRLSGFLHNFSSLSPDVVPGDSILREYIGGSQLAY